MQTQVSKDPYLNLMSSDNEFLSQFEPISLDEMDECKLMSRFDAKFTFNIDLLPRILEKATTDYRVLTIHGKNLMKYKTIYFDTKSMDMYLKHHNGKKQRYKIRIREYCDTFDKYLEVKNKNNKGNVKKTRIKIDSAEISSMRDQTFIRKYTPYDPELLYPGVKVKFSRITLAEKSFKERITIDTNISFEYNGVKRMLPRIVVAEIKSSGNFGNSQFYQILRQFRINTDSFSKYCIGTSLVHENIKKNLLKNQIYNLYKLQQQTINK